MKIAPVLVTINIVMMSSFMFKRNNNIAIIINIEIVSFYQKTDILGTVITP